jgi:DNA-3-methyladenine glycosylase II
VGFPLLSGLNNINMKQAINYLSQKDEKLKFIIDIFGHPIIQKRQEGFASMCHIILEQQVSIESAKACYVKLQNLFISINPEIIFNCSDEELRSCGVSRQKIIYLKDLASKVISKQIDFESYPSKSEEEIRAELITVKGVGNWSIEVYLMFCLQLQDIIPLGDIAIKNTLKELYNCQTHEEMQFISDNWKPYRTAASFTVWHYYLKKRNKI